MRVFFFQRNPGTADFSIETLFNSIIKHMPKEVKPTVSISKYVNSGAFSKLYNIFEILFKKQGDVNHVTGDVHYITFFLKKKKTVLTVHDVNLMYTDNVIKKTIHKWFWLRIPVMCSRFVTVISETTKSELLKYVNCSPDKIKVIYNCISPAFTPQPKAFNKVKPTILQIGCRPNKNLPGVIEAIKDIDCRLEIIGKPTEEELELLKKHNIDFHSQFKISEEEVVQKYIECDMLVFASFYEGFGLPIIEANIIERPVVTSNISSMPEMAGNAACLVDPYNPESIREGILKVIEDDNYREQLIENGRINRKRFSPEEVAKQYFNLYKDILKESSDLNVPDISLLPENAL